MLRMWLIAIAALASLLAALPVAAQDQAATIYAVSGRNRLVTFSADAPGTILNDVRVTGLDKGDRLVGIDVRPADGMLYGVGVDRGTVRYTGSILRPARRPWLRPYRRRFPGGASGSTSTPWSTGCGW